MIIDSKKAIEEIKNINKIKTDKELSKIINIPLNTITTWKKRNKIDWNVFIVAKLNQLIYFNLDLLIEKSKKRQISLFFPSNNHKKAIQYEIEHLENEYDAIVNIDVASPNDDITLVDCRELEQNEIIEINNFIDQDMLKDCYLIFNDTKNITFLDSIDINPDFILDDHIFYRKKYDCDPNLFYKFKDVIKKRELNRSMYGMSPIW